MDHLKRTHIDKYFVLVFSVDENPRVVTLEDLTIMIQSISDG